MFNPAQLTKAYEQACLAEIEALKPGNVHIFADGHGMQVQDFIDSAKASAAVIAQADLALGERIFRSVESTWHAVECNTNLGIVLLCAPLVQSALTMQEGTTLESALKRVLQTTSIDDAQRTFDAIKLANPAGLGSSETHDVNSQAQCNLYEAMQAAEDKDTIAKQYAVYFHDVFHAGLQQYASALQLWQRPAWAMTATHLFWMSTYPDSHVARKHGLAAAVTLQSEAMSHLKHFLNQSNPKIYQAALLEFDRSLKAREINPGTSADLTVATCLVQYLLNEL